MQLARFFVVCVVLLGRICFSKNLIKTSKPDGYTELEDAAIKFLTNCYGDKDKAMVLAGDIPGTFANKLSTQQSHSIALLENQPESVLHRNFLRSNPYARHKVRILVAMATSSSSFIDVALTYVFSKHHGVMASVLIIGWSPEKIYGPCDSNVAIMNTLLMAHRLQLPDVNIICRDIEKGIVIYGYNAFTNYAPKPWQLVETRKFRAHPRGFSYFMRQYREHKENLCENLFFEKLQNANGQSTEVLRICFQPPCRSVIVTGNKLVQIEDEICRGVIRDFLRYVHFTEKTIWYNAAIGKGLPQKLHVIGAVPILLGGVPWFGTSTYPYMRSCNFLVTEYRGSKSQIQKIYDVLDRYSWGGMIVVYFITVIFFKYVLRQPLIEGILNLWRLTCSLGLLKLPPNVPPRIYLGCLLFFMVTMQGIFTSSLASVMTQDVSVRQVNTIQDLIDLGYTVYEDRIAERYYKDLADRGRFVPIKMFSDCYENLKRNDLAACSVSGVLARLRAMRGGFYISKGCIRREYLVIGLPHNWAFQGLLTKYLEIRAAGGIMTNLEVLVHLKRSVEKELEEKIVEPEIMVLSDLDFAFAIWGIGWGCALVSFIVEVMIPTYQKKLRDHPKFNWIRRCVR